MTDYVKETAILGLVVLETVAIWKGVDGVLLSVVIALIAGIAGYRISDYIKEVT